jgi:hypothetical protein
MSTDSLLTIVRVLHQIAPLEPVAVAAAAAAADRLALTQRLDMSVVDLPPEEPSLNLTQLVPELDLISEKDKDKKDSDEEEEVRKNN